MRGSSLVIATGLGLALMTATATPALAEGGGHVRGSDHYTGQAHDYMVGSRGEGARVATCALGLPGVTYVIWRRQINHGGGWERMGNRGSPTANHMNHVHVSWESPRAMRNSKDRCG